MSLWELLILIYLAAISVAFYTWCWKADGGDEWNEIEEWEEWGE